MIIFVVVKELKTNEYARLDWDDIFDKLDTKVNLLNIILMIF